MENPPRINWHIEKDGIYIAKGNGILKFAAIDSYYRYDHYAEDMKKYRSMSREDYKKDLVQSYKWNNYYTTDEQAEKAAERHIKDIEEKIKLADQFEAFINKIDTTCGGLIGDGEAYTYEKVKVTEYKKEIKPVETSSGSIKEGQCFLLKASFSYGCYK